MSDANLPVSDGSFTDSGPNTAVSFDVTTWSCDGYTQRSVLPDWVVSEPQNQVDTRSRSRSRPPLTDDRRRIDRVEESTRGPTGVASSSQLPVPERSTPKILTHGLFYHSHRMPLNYIGSKNNNSAGLRILHITLAFRII